jgi:lipopolysaccharide/colanic/teichoic acid biosynthesis glycosyltransferase
MLKRIMDITVSFSGLLILSPFLVILFVLIWLQDFNSPFYIAPRMAKGGGKFRMVKLRSMVFNADKTGVSSTSATDLRITKVGAFVRKYKLDEIMQLWNVLKGDMSLVGPRPQVEVDASLYTQIEKNTLDVRPGITDMASIVFSDEGEILAGTDNPDLKYNQIIRPWKSRLALIYIEYQSIILDIKLIVLTAINVINREKALIEIEKILKSFGADELLIRMARRNEPLIAYAPPGADEIVSNYPK